MRSGRREGRVAVATGEARRIGATRRRQLAGEGAAAKLPDRTPGTWGAANILSKAAVLLASKGLCRITGLSMPVNGGSTAAREGFDDSPA